MITRIKLFGKSILRSLNNAAGSLLPIVDTRKGGQIEGIEKIELTQPVTIKGDAPNYHYDTNEKAPYWISMFREGLEVPPCFMLILNNAYMVSRGVIIYNNKVLLESAIFQREYLDKLLSNHSITKTLVAKPKKQLGNVIPLLNKLSNNYYHWTTESLTRLAMFAEYSKEDYNDYYIVIAEDAPEFVKESLIHLFHIAANKIITWKNNATGALKKCVLLSYPFIREEKTVMTNVYSLPLYKLLNTISLKNIPSASGDEGYIIISRANVNQRKLLGDDRIIKAFPSIPFKIINTEEMSYVEQVIAFRNAKIIIGPHGAGLVNLIYVTKNPLVIEIFPTLRKIRDAGAYHQIAREMNLNYYLLVKTPVNNDQDIEISESIIAEIKSILTQNNY